MYLHVINILRLNKIITLKQSVYLKCINDTRKRPLTAEEIKKKRSELHLYKYL